LDDLPISLDNEWEKYVDTPLTEKELDELRKSVDRQIPYGRKKWKTDICRELGLEHTLRPIGRPKRHLRGRRKLERT
jgi:putative transposase